MSDGKIISINRSKTKGVKKNPQDEGILVENFGLKDDAHAGNWHRQVSLLAIESIRKMESDKLSFNPGDFAENITTEGINLYNLPIGTKFQIGEVLLELTQIGKKCHDGCQIKQMTGYCIMPREGIFAKVLKGGLVKKYDTIKVLV